MEYQQIDIALTIFRLSFCPFYRPSEVFAAREKHGIYIPRDRFLIEEAEKKVGLQMLSDHLYSFSEKIHYYHAFTRLQSL